MNAPDPMQAPALTWGILGAGGIAAKLADAVTNYTASTVRAVASRSLDKAQAFAGRHGIATSYGSYEELVADPTIDIIYVATPHSHHRDHALLAINAGKHVLCEKALTQNSAQAEEVVNAARAKGVFLMEAMWTRHLPHVYALREALAAGEIGEIVTIQADHGQSLGHVERMIKAELAGGALLDLGVYPISFTHDLLGVPQSITAVGHLTDAGVDSQVGMILGYGSAQATLHTTMHAVTANRAVISGTKGRIEVESMFYTPNSFTVTLLDGTTRTVDGTVDNGFQFQAAEAARRIAAGDTESPLMTLEGSLDVMRTMDEVRAQIGMVYPNER